MARVHIDDLTPGKVLHQQVCDRSGRMLLPAGETLNDRHLNIFRMWGVVEVEIEGDEVVSESQEETGSQLDPVLYAQMREEVEGLFIHNDPAHPAVKELMKICIERRAARAV